MVKSQAAEFALGDGANFGGDEVSQAVGRYRHLRCRLRPRQLPAHPQADSDRVAAKATSSTIVPAAWSTHGIPLSPLVPRGERGIFFLGALTQGGARASLT